jgi:hypothetical protein
MSNNPYSAPNHGESSGPMMAGTPTSLPGGVMVVAILSLLLGAWNLLSGFCGLVGVLGFTALTSSAVMKDALEKDPEAAAQIQQAGAQIAGQFVPMVIVLLLTGLLGLSLVIGGIGTLTRKEWGRSLLSKAGLFGGIVGVASLAWQFLSGQMNPANNPAIANMPAEQVDQARTFMNVAMIFGIVLGLAFVAFYFFVWRYLADENKRQYFT